MDSFRTVRTILILAVGALLLTRLSYAQDEAASDTSSSQFTDEQVESVANAFVAIQQLRQKYQQEHGNPQDLDSTQVAQIRKEFQGESQQVIQDEGITRGTFGQVLQAAQSDTTLRGQLYTEIEEAGGQVPEGSAGQSGSAPDVNQDQIQKAGEAFAQIQQVRQRFQSQYGSVQDSTRQQQIQRKYQMATQKAIQSAGLSPVQFSQVIRAAQSDPNVRQQFFSAIEAAGGSPPQPSGQAPPQGQSQPAPAPSPAP